MSRRSGRDTWTHGLTGYTNHHCRCDVCRTAMSTYQHDYRVRREHREHPPPPPSSPSDGHTWPELVAAELDRLEQEQGK